jgi:polar amino acid transport system permease protein
MDALLESFFNVEIYRQVLPYLLQGLWTTLWLSLLVVPLGIAGGLALAIASTQTKRRSVRIAVAVYVDLFRAFPPLVLLILIYFGSPFLGVEFPKLVAVALGFMLNNSSYFAEVFRAGLGSIPTGQAEAARASGLSAAQTLRYVLVPQATRNVLPDLLGNVIEVIKMTSLASVVALPELLKAARDAQSMLYNPSPIVLCALLYLAILWPLVRWLTHIEKRRRLGQT